jgi:spoIIIJ-associated protein
MSEEKTFVTATGNSVDDAIEQGLKELGVTINDVEIEVVEDGNRGFLGIGSKSAEVTLWLKGTKPAQPEPAPQSETDTPAAPPEVEDIPDTASGADDVAIIAQDVVKELLTKMGVKASVSAKLVQEEGNFRPNILVDINGDDLSILIGRRAETLNALQYITRLIMGKELGRSINLSVDVEGYRARKEERLVRIAKQMAKQAVETGRRQTLEPMPSNERRIIHITLRKHPEVYTESVGEGNHRKVTIHPKD